MAREISSTDTHAMYEVALRCPCKQPGCVVTLGVCITKATTDEKMDCCEVAYAHYPHFVEWDTRRALYVAACFEAMAAFKKDSAVVAVRTTRHGFDVFAPTLPSAFAVN